MAFVRYILLVVALLTLALRAADASHASRPFIEPMPHGQLHDVKEAIEEAIFGNCFLAGTDVETSSRGGVAVEDVRMGDRIAPPPGHSCEDPRCGEVVRLFRNTTDRVVTITAVARPRARKHRAAARDGGEAGEEDGEPPSASQTIRCTPGHPFFVQGRGWIFAGDLRPGDEFDARGERVVVAAVEVRAEQAETFNFEVRCHHTYRVSGAAGQPAVLVHNTSIYARAMALRRASFRKPPVPAMGGARPATMHPGQIRFMQRGISNATGGHTVLGNAAALRAGTLKPSDLPAIGIFRDTRGIVWTVDHRRLAAFRLAGVENIPVRWLSKGEALKHIRKKYDPTEFEGLSVWLRGAGRRVQ